MLYQIVGIYHKYGSNVSQRVDNNDQFTKKKIAYIPDIKTNNKRAQSYKLSLPPLYNTYVR